MLAPVKAVNEKMIQPVRWKNWEPGTQRLVATSVTALGTAGTVLTGAYVAAEGYDSWDDSSFDRDNPVLVENGDYKINEMQQGEEYRVELMGDSFEERESQRLQAEPVIKSDLVTGEHPEFVDSDIRGLLNREYVLKYRGEPDQPFQSPNN